MTGKNQVVKDGGWGWIVVAASFLCHCIVDGCVVSVGVVYTHLLNYFEETKSKTALVGSLFVGFTLLLGTAGGILVEQFGCRAVTILGGILTAVGFISSAFAPSINVLYFTYSIVAPTGIAFVSVPAVVIVSSYFEKKRSFALGVALCGTGIGTLVFPPLCELMIQEYGWRGMMLLMGGIVLNFIVGGALFRPQPLFDLSDSILIEEDSKHNGNNLPLGAIPADCRPLVHAVKTTGGSSQTGLNRINALLVYSSCRIDTPFCSTPALARFQDGCISEKSLTKDRIVTPATSCPELALQYQREEAMEQDAKVSKLVVLKNVICNPFVEIYQTIILTKTAFWCALFFVHNFVFFFWLDVPYVFLVDRAILSGIKPTPASFLLSIVGILDTIGQVVYGFLGDKKFINNSILYGISVMLCGIVVAGFTLNDTFVYTAFMSALFGFFVSSNYTLCTVLVIEHLGEKTLAVTCGILMMWQGLGNLSGPPLAGMMFDILGRYDEAFLAAGILMSLSAIPAILPYLARRYRDHKQSVYQNDKNISGEDIST